MRPSVHFACIIVLAALSPVVAGDVTKRPLSTGQPFGALDPTPRTLSQFVVKSDACWRTCTASCGSSFQICSKAHWINECRAESDVCDLACLKSCRSFGGPLLGITDSGP